MGSSPSHEPVDGSTLPLEGVDHIWSRQRLPSRVLHVGQSVSHYLVEEGTHDLPGMAVHVARDPLHPTSPSQPPDGA